MYERDFFSPIFRTQFVSLAVIPKILPKDRSKTKIFLSQDAHPSRYAAIVRVQANRVEIIQDLSDMVKDLIMMFYKSTGGYKPHRVIMYRYVFFSKLDFKPWPIKTRMKYRFMNMKQLHILFNKPKLDIGLFVDFCVFTYFYKFLHHVILKLFCSDLQNNFMITLCKNW